ncbi:hypothetical protein A4A49_51996 [Nicotiana attenuata]|uniref:Uncharacterized protein n=1 Tax=Nicotiana attenuata TaxID=49451 RepID=A0A314KR24_NICAT|nr:hypothetical protein A4A49_51996 [Nicotiana attenuata]
MRSYIVLSLISMAVFFALFNPSLGELKFCPASFTTNGTCDKVDCGDLALFKWAACQIPHSCACSASGSNQSLCTCQIVC